MVFRLVVTLMAIPGGVLIVVPLDLWHSARNLGGCFADTTQTEALDL